MAPPASALAVANEFRRDLLSCGVPQVSIELMIGRSGRWVSTGSHGGTSFVVNLGHHIASNPSASNPTPGLWVVKNGRPGIPAPLCNVYGGMDLIARIICLDWANHPGEGGPWTIDGFRIPRDGGRPYLLGWEHEGGFSTAVWDATYTNKATGKRMTYREFMGRCHAGTLKFLGRPRTSHGEHSTWADLKQIGRKIDRLGYGHPVGTAATKGINELTPYYLGTTEDEDDMFTDADRAMLKRLSSVVASHSDEKIDRPDTATGTAGMRFALEKAWEDTHALTEPIPWQSPGVREYVKNVVGWVDAATGEAKEVRTRYLIEAIFSYVHQAHATLAQILGRDLADVDEAALAQALVTLLPQLDTQRILDALSQLPEAIRLELKAAL
jgi:hypothetical protein